MRSISFAHTTAQFLDGTKDVTRRRGWKALRPGTRLMAVRKAMGLKKGESPERLGPIEVVSVRSEPLDAIDADDVVREGYPGLSPAEFVARFVAQMGVPDQVVQRIEFRRLGPEDMAAPPPRS